MINSPGVNEFIDLKDAPNSYTGQASKVVKVNVGETAVEFGAGGGGAGTVTDVSVVTANGVSGSVATSTTTPAITLTLGAITPSSVGSVGAVTGSNLSGTNTGDNAVNTLYSGLATSKVDANTAITGATKTKITYDTKGLVTSGADATTADIADSLNKRYVTDANLTTIGNQSGTNTGDNATNTQYSGLVSNATHTGDAEGATSLVVKRINGVALSGLATGILKNTTTTGVPSIAINSDLPVMSATVGGAVPTPPNNTTTFLRGDGTFAAPAGGVSDGDKGDISVTASGATWTIDAGVVTAAKTTITGTTDGSKYLRDDWSWQAVTGGSGLTQPQVMARLSVGF